MISPQWDNELGSGGILVFWMMHRFYKTIVVLAALISGLAVGALQFDEFHQTSSGLIRVSEGFLCSAAVTAVISAVVATMLLFQFEGIQKITRKDFAIAWLPLTLLDISIVEFLLGMVCWYSSKNVQWRGAVMATQLAALLTSCVALSTWMLWNWQTRAKPEPSTKKEDRPTTTIVKAVGK